MHSIPSVINQDYKNWELIVVGDGCADETEQVVNSFGDSRIRFFNLEKNSGQQATPNNFGMSKARGQFVAFLNQDDLFFPDHLSKSLEEIEKSEADFLIVPGIKVMSSKKEDFEKGNFQVQLCSVHPDGRYSTNVFSVASTWFFKQELIRKLGPWLVDILSCVLPVIKRITIDSFQERIINYTGLRKMNDAIFIYHMVFINYCQ